MDVTLLLFENLRALIVLPLVTAVLAVTVTILFLHGFRAESEFLPQSTESNALGQYAGLAAQFGVSVPSIGGESVALYAKLIHSRDLLEALARTEFTVTTDREGGDTIRGNLLDLYEIEEDTPAQEMLQLVQRLRDEITTAVDLEAGTVAVVARAPWPGLAEAINSRVLDLVEEFNVEHRQSQAHAQREFVGQRLEETRQALRNGENAVQQFLEGNRVISDSPQLQAEYARLQRRVDLQQQLYITLSQAFEQAKIDEVRDLPVITVLSSPEGSAKPTASLTMAVLMGLIIGGMIAIAVVFVREFFREQERLEPRKVEELRNHWSSLLGPLAPKH